MAFPTKLSSTLFFLIAWRLLSVYIVQTSDVPDEYWQSLEVAHRLAFGYGYLTWEWSTKIRSYIYPFLISILYRLLAILRLDYVVILTTLPRIFQASLSGYADYRFYVWTRSKWALFSLCTNWFWYTCATRTLINSVETSLTIVALSIFPWPDGRIRSSGYIWIIGLLVAMRPTAAILWTPMCLYHICTSSKNIVDLMKTYCLAGICTLAYSILIDSLCYGSVVVTGWEFFKVNVLNDVAKFYGTQHLLWYLVVGVPVIIGLQAFILPFAAFQAIKKFSIHRQQIVMVLVVFWSLIVYSSQAHKEFRFILPLLPMLIHVCTSSFPFRLRITEFRRKVFLSIFVLSNLIPGFYVSVIHQRGTLDAMKSLRYDLNNDNLTDIMILTPCHATPLYSHLHVDLPIRFLTCEPNLQQSSDYVDEADEFFIDPAVWIRENIEKKNIPLPDLLVMFDNLSPKIETFLKNYRIVVKLFHTHFPQRNYGKYIVVYRRI